MADGDIPKVRVNPNTKDDIPDTIKILWITKTLIATYREVDANRNPIGRETNEIFMDRTDNPDTPEDESSTEFTDLITEIDKGNNIKLTITDAVIARRSA